LLYGLAFYKRNKQQNSLKYENADKRSHQEGFHFFLRVDLPLVLPLPVGIGTGVTVTRPASFAVSAFLFASHQRANAADSTGVTGR
jgi:hypothetical protein